MNKVTRRERYLRDPLPIRLGGIAANLARVASSAENSRDHRAVASMLYESKWFIEWAAPSAPIDTAAVMVELQQALVRWEKRWAGQASDPDVRVDIARFAEEWSDRLLQMSGLLDAELA